MSAWDEVLTLIDGHVDAHPLASLALTPGTRLWTRDSKLHRVAELLGCAHPESTHGSPVCRQRAHKGQRVSPL